MLRSRWLILNALFFASLGSHSSACLTELGRKHEEFPRASWVAQQRQCATLQGIRFSVRHPMQHDVRHPAVPSSFQSSDKTTTFLGCMLWGAMVLEHTQAAVGTRMAELPAPQKTRQNCNMQNADKACACTCSKSQERWARWTL